MHYAMQLFFFNGGGPCYIVSVGNYFAGGGIIEATALQQGLAAELSQHVDAVFKHARTVGTRDSTVIRR